MQQEDIKTITLSEIIEIVKRHKLTLVLCTLFAIIPVLIYNHIATPIYRATAVVVFENFSKGMMPELDNPFAQSNFITNRIEEIKTRTFARQVHDELPEKVKELFRLPTPSPEGFVVDEFIVSHIRKNIEVEPV
ncbi:MAG: Wzz/FepE/Etk N-terminal domain-containing protein, partial [bacterium]